ncbi:MAG: hypothetical protein J5829_00235 [Lachnospiraceae bacterium]|nr:hypothetical protein [Lachnospiraceae bacterium]
MSVPYRRAAMEKHSSPDRLDVMIKIIPPVFWVAVMGGVLIAGIIVLWSILGKLPVDLQTVGIYISRDGIHSVYSKNSGIVEEVYIRAGNEISENQIIARYSMDKANDDLNLLAERRAKVEAVTLESTGDVETADNQSLISIKTNLLTVSSNLNANESMLEMRTKQLEEQRKKTDEAREAMQLARNMFYATMNTGTDTKEQLEYQTAATNLSSAVSLHESAKVTLSNFHAQSDEVMSQYEDQIDKLKKKKKEETEESKIEEITKQIEDLQAKLDQLRSQEDELESAVNERAGARGSAENWYFNTAQAYIDTEKMRLAKQTFANQQSDNYNLALTDYNTQLSLLRSLEDSVSQLDVNVASEGEGVVDQFEVLRKQFDSAKATALDNLDAQIRMAKEQIEETQIRSTLNGYVIDVNIDVGSPVQPGTAICNVSQSRRDVAMSAGAAGTDGYDGDAGSFEVDSDYVVICYVPAADGRKIKPGMKVKVYPSTINKEEYGHMSAVVSKVSDYVISQEELVNQLGDQILASSFLNKGAVVEVTCELDKDPSTVSGYKWSSKKGAEIAIDPGTMVATDTVIEDKAPISMVIPHLKKKFHSFQPDPFGRDEKKDNK